MPSERSDRFGTADYADHYATVNDLSDRRYEETATWYQRILADVLGDLRHDAKLLDVGCGAGLLLHALRRAGFTHITGFDASESLCSLAAARGLPVRHVATDFIETASGEIPERYDVIFLLDVLEHIPTARHMAFLAGLRMLLQSGGQLVIAVPNATSALASRWRHIDWTHETAFTEHSLRFVLKASGFHDIRFLPHEFFSRPRFPFLLRRSVLHWWLHRLMRGFRRLQVVGELGTEGWNVPLSLNLLAVAARGGASTPSCHPGDANATATPPQADIRP
jgi:2-polyprenyl-3-methyl-5-hydroxy-6-metoxy-1,4-benzoquinol methylase